MSAAPTPLQQVQPPRSQRDPWGPVPSERRIRAPWALQQPQPEGLTDVAQWARYRCDVLAQEIEFQMRSLSARLAQFADDAARHRGEWTARGVDIADLQARLAELTEMQRVVAMDAQIKEQLAREPR